MYCKLLLVIFIGLVIAEDAVTRLIHSGHWNAETINKIVHELYIILNEILPDFTQYIKFDFY